MKLWLVTQDVLDGYDTYDGMVVCAETEEEARCTSPSHHYVWASGVWHFPLANGGYHVYERRDDWPNPEQVKVQYIGEASTEVQAGVVLASFNAG